MGFSEKRKYPRVQESVACDVAVGPRIFKAETRDLSCGGALCRLSHEVPPLTKLKINLALPAADQEQPTDSIQCLGIVVRQEKADGQAYLTAIFFSDLKQEDRRRIAEFVLQSMFKRDRKASTS